jgi:hypothetical protein
MTFSEMHKERSEAVNKARANADRREDRIEQRLKDNWEAVNKAIYALIVGHAAGLVACMTLLKEPGPLKGVGTFITVFGLGFFFAVISAAVWIIGRFNFWVFPDWILKVAAKLGRPFPKRLNIRTEIRDWWTAPLAFISTFLMVLAGAIAVCKFGTL